jgi:hypothetical protein
MRKASAWIVTIKHTNLAAISISMLFDKPQASVPRPAKITAV